VRREIPLGAGLPPVCRLGLATRGGGALAERDVEAALERGVNYLNWCGRPDGLSRAAARLGARRAGIVLAVQLEATERRAAERELEAARRELAVETIDVVTFYYVESRAQWEAIRAPDGAYAAMARARERGRVRLLGLTSHQRAMAAALAASEGRPLDLLMLRYNAAHRGAERDVFPVTGPLGIPVVVYTCLRWGALARPTPHDPPGFVVPPPREWYRFALGNPAAAVALCAPNDGAELAHDLGLLDDWRAPTDAERRALADHGERVRRSAGKFP
jgi:predicted aldo/keto reductase-like oxidoreductase